MRRRDRALNKERYNFELIFLLLGFIFLAGLSWRESLQENDGVALIALGSVFTTLAVLCAVELTDQFMFGANEDR